MEKINFPYSILSATNILLKSNTKISTGFWNVCFIIIFADFIIFLLIFHTHVYDLYILILMNQLNWTLEYKMLTCRFLFSYMKYIHSLNWMMLFFFSLEYIMSLFFSYNFLFYFLSGEPVLDFFLFFFVCALCSIIHWRYKRDHWLCIYYFR